MDKNAQIAEKVTLGRAEQAVELVQKALDEGLDPQDILQHGLLAGMGVIGDRFKKQEVYIPEVIMSARAMKMGMEILRRVLTSKDSHSAGLVVMGTVKGDLHDIGKNLVCMMLEGAGFEVIDMGIDVTEEKFVREVSEKRPHILGLSALLTVTMPAMEHVIGALDSAGLRRDVNVMIGGAPVTEAFAARIGADGYASDAASAVDKAKELLGSG